MTCLKGRCVWMAIIGNQVIIIPAMTEKTLKTIENHRFLNKIIISLNIELNIEDN